MNDMGFDDDGNQVPTVDFDYDALDGEAPEPTGTDDTIGNLLAWLGGDRATAYFGKAFSHRLTALSWAADPAQFQGRSLSDLARERGLTPAALSKYAAQASKVFGLRNRSQLTHDPKRVSTPALK
jgi:hypothetical protein